MIYLLSRENRDGYKEPVCYFQNQENAQRVCDKLNSFINVANMSYPSDGREPDYLKLFLAVKDWCNACIQIYDPDFSYDWEYYTVTPVHSVLSAHTKELAKLLISPAPSVAH